MHRQPSIHHYNWCIWQPQIAFKKIYAKTINKRFHGAKLEEEANSKHKQTFQSLFSAQVKIDTFFGFHET